MTKGKLKANPDLKQSNVEGLMGTVAVSLVLLDHDRLRIEQAIRRAGLADLLQPVVIDYLRISQNLKSVQETLRGEWESGQLSRWE
jgi:hypothetical protein